MQNSGATGAKQMTILFSCVGRRIELMQAFRAAARRLDITLRLIAVDRIATAPGLYCADVPLLVPPVTSDQYIPALLDVVKKYDVEALIPTIDTELPALSRHRDDFAALGCHALIATPEVINICRDKTRTFTFLQQQGIDTPKTYTQEQVQAWTNPTFPLFIKPRTGSASQWVHKIEDARDLEYHLQKVRDPIIQEFVEGDEHTLDVYVGLTGEPRCVVPRVRWQVRTGEVCKGAVVKDHRIMDAGRQVVQALGNTVRGLVTLQCIVTPQGRIRFIEINPRFGGGAPLAIAAGADFPAWLLNELRGQTPPIDFAGFQHGLCMLRYDWSAFVPLDSNLQPRIRPPLRQPPPFEDTNP